MLDSKLLEILACPWCLGELDYRDDKLACRRCKAVYAVVDDIPNMLVEEAELHCPLCGGPMEAAGGKASCAKCEREWSTEERLTDI